MPSTITTDPNTPHILDKAADAALALAEERLWADITLRDIAVAAGATFADLYAKAPGKAALLERLSARFDRAALTTAELEPASDPHDRLFEAVMARLEAMEPHRAALIAIGRSEGLAALGPRLPRTARALLEASGIDTGGVKGAARVALRRLEQLIQEAVITVPKALIAETIDLVAVLRGRGSERRLSELALVACLDPATGDYRVQSAGAGGAPLSLGDPS